MWLWLKRSGDGWLEQVISEKALREGWRRVRANGGGAGGDGVSLRAFARRLDRELACLRREVLEGSYRPGPLRAARMPKRDGGFRPLRIPCVRDRVLQAACQLVLTRHLDARLHPRSFAYRPGRSVDMALACLRGDMSEGFVWLLDADIRRFFDEVDHALLRRDLRRWVADARLRRLLALWLAGFSGEGRGLAQGAPISPWLSNIFLHPLDEALHGGPAGAWRLVRYADDFMVACRSRSEAQAALQRAREVLAARRLALHGEKTRIVAARAGVAFLGSRLRLRVDRQEQTRR